jgi:hypothetical protein
MLVVIQKQYSRVTVETSKRIGLLFLKIPPKKMTLTAVNDQN